MPATDELSTVFSALADPTRRSILMRLMAGDASVAELARCAGTRSRPRLGCTPSLGITTAPEPGATRQRRRPAPVGRPGAAVRTRLGRPRSPSPRSRPCRGPSARGRWRAPQRAGKGLGGLREAVTWSCCFRVLSGGRGTTQPLCGQISTRRVVNSVVRQRRRKMIKIDQPRPSSDERGLSEETGR